MIDCNEFLMGSHSIHKPLALDLVTSALALPKEGTLDFLERGSTI